MGPAFDVVNLVPRERRKIEILITASGKSGNIST